MVVDTQKESLSINKLVCQKRELISVEGDMIVPDSKPDILNTIDTSGNICVYKKELTDEKLKIDGNISAYIIYLADNTEDNVRGLNANLDFSESIALPNCRAEMLLDTNINIKTIECNVINGRKVSVKVELEANINVYSNENIELINSISDSEDIQVLENRLNVNSLVGCGNTRAYVKDTVMIDNTDNLAEILKVSINMVDKDIKTSYNKVLAKAEAEIKIMYLTEENQINIVTNKIPVVGFIDIQNVSEENVCDTSFEIKNMIIKPNNVEEHSIYVELEVEVSCMAYEEKEINLIQDLYSPLEEVECKQKEIETIAEKENRREVCNISESVNIPEIENGNLIDVNIRATILKESKLNSRIMYEGEMALDFIIWNSTSSNMNIKTINLPFEFVVDNIENSEDLSISTQLEIGMQDFMIQSGVNINCNIDIIFYLNIYKNVKLNIIDNIQVTENRDLEDYSLIIYLVKSGDTLWKIAKKFRSTVDDIVRTNGIENPDLIYPGEKLYIPKYKKKEIQEMVENPQVVNYV